MNNTNNPFQGALAALIILALLSGCAGQTNTKQNEVPASVYRNSLRSIFSDVQSIHNIKQSIFKPVFLDYLAYLTRNGVSLNEQAIQDSVKRWNAVATDKAELIKYNRAHFTGVASLHNPGQRNCTQTKQCEISILDVNILRTWMQWRLDYTLTTPWHSIDHHQLLLLNPDKDPELHLALVKLSGNRVGSALLRHALDSGLSIRTEQLSGSHGYYDHSENAITLDQSVVGYEFNLRYLVHELLHACNTADDNSITEEVLAELIGLQIQNQITGIRFDINPYLVFVEHILHPDYGQLTFSNDIYGELAMVGIEL